MDFSSLNYLAILVAAVAAFFVGFLWHGPLFGKQWLKMMNIPQSEVDAARAKGMGPMLPMMIAAFVQQFIVAVVTAHLVNALGIADAMTAVLFATLLWFGYIATTLLNGVLWEKRSMNLYVFNIAYHLVALVVIALIVTLWK